MNKIEQLKEERNELIMIAKESSMQLEEYGNDDTNLRWCLQNDKNSMWQCVNDKKKEIKRYIEGVDENGSRCKR